MIPPVRDLHAPRAHAHAHTSAAEPARPASSARAGWIGAAVLLLAGGAYWFHGHEAAPAPAAPPPTPVVVQTMAEKNLRIWSQFSGRLHAVDYAEIRPEVSGRITEVRFEDGQSVKAGDILFVIDPGPYEAAASRAEARVATAQANLAFAKADQERAATLVHTEAISQREYDQADSARKSGSAELEAAEAELKNARIDLDHAYVKAPISGRVSRAELTVGNLVERGPAAPVLTSVASKDGIYADFEVDEQTYLDSIRAAARGNAQEQKIPVQLVLQGSGRVYDGFIQSFDNRLDTASGTIRARARFENEDGTLLPGMFVSVRLAGARELSAILVPERAVSSDQSHKFVYVVDASNKVVYREVVLGKKAGDRRVVEKGLQAGDRVIVDGIQRVRPGAAVAPQEQPAPAGEKKEEDLLAAHRQPAISVE
ncbi:MAG: efflux RND transporter periplasmic adaptor subunit [Verrucomicrobium sp.]|nr:efflux RND transporter periplasmic adaptor subunit [Verrucomicrobium sp.]